MTPFRLAMFTTLALTSDDPATRRVASRLAVSLDLARLPITKASVFA